MLKHLLDKVAYPIGTVFYFHLKKTLGIEPERLIKEDPGKFYTAFKQLFKGDEEKTDYMLRILIRLTNARYLPEEATSEAIERLCKAIKTGDKKETSRYIERLRESIERGAGAGREARGSI